MPETPEQQKYLSTLECALVLISAKVRFWSDGRAPRGNTQVYNHLAYCMDPGRLEELRQSLIEIDKRCKNALLTRPKQRSK